MRAPLSWVAESVDLPPDTTPRQLGDALVRVGLEVERVAAAADAVGGPVVIGRVWSMVNRTLGRRVWAGTLLALSSDGSKAVASLPVVE